MAARGYKQLETQLSRLVQPHFDGLTVEVVANSIRWNRPCATFRWAGFIGLLPEERFQRLAAVVNESFRETHMRGVVWLELAPGETVDEFLRMPRSEDVAPREGHIYQELVRIGFFEALAQRLSPSPTDRCKGGFADSTAVLEEKRIPSEAITEAKLAFIAQGAYCDCQALLSARPALASRHAGAA